MCAACSAVSTAVPVNRSATTVWPRVISTISATSPAVRRIRSRSGAWRGGPRRCVMPAAQQSVPGECLVVAQQVLAQALRVGVGDAVADVVGDGAEVVDVVVEALGLEQQGADGLGLRLDLDAEGVLDGQHVGQGVADGGVAADPLGQLDALGGGRAPRTASRRRGAGTTAGPSSAGWSRRRPRTGSGPARSGPRGWGRRGSRRRRRPRPRRTGRSRCRGRTGGRDRRRGASGSSRWASGRGAPVVGAAGGPRGGCRTGRGSRARTARRGRRPAPVWGSMGRRGGHPG